MSLHDYEISKQVQLLDGVTFFGVVMAAMRMADTANRVALQDAFPQTWNELLHRYHAPGGVLDND